MVRYGYCGERCPWFLPTCVWEGWVDALTFKRFEQLYRYPWYKRLGYLVGWLVGRPRFYLRSTW